MNVDNASEILSPLQGFLCFLLVNYGSFVEVEGCVETCSIPPLLAIFRFFTRLMSVAILDLEARRKAKEASKARSRKIRRMKQQQRMRQVLVKQALTFVLAILLIVVNQTVVRTVWSKLPCIGHFLAQASFIFLPTPILFGPVFPPLL